MWLSVLSFICKNVVQYVVGAAVYPHMLSARIRYCILQNIYEYCKLQMNIVHGTSGGAQTGVAFLCFKYDEKHRNVLTKR